MGEKQYIDEQGGGGGGLRMDSAETGFDTWRAGILKRPIALLVHNRIGLGKYCSGL